MLIEKTHGGTSVDWFPNGVATLRTEDRRRGLEGREDRPSQSGEDERYCLPLTCILSGYDLNAVLLTNLLVSPAI